MRIGQVMVAAVLATTAAGEAGAQDAPELPAWMAGCWEARDGDRWSEECWTIPRAGMMMGSGRSGDGDQLQSWEVMRVTLDMPNGDGPVVRMAYVASPGGGEATIFAWSPAQEEGVTFVNEAHDYPQRIRYWRDGDVLNAEISRADGSHAMSWTLTRMGG